MATEIQEIAASKIHEGYLIIVEETEAIKFYHKNTYKITISDDIKIYDISQSEAIDGNAKSKETTKTKISHEHETECNNNTDHKENRNGCECIIANNWSAAIKNTTLHNEYIFQMDTKNNNSDTLTIGMEK